VGKIATVVAKFAVGRSHIAFDGGKLFVLQ